MKKKILAALFICMSIFLCISQNVYAEKCADGKHNWDWVYKDNQYHRAECVNVGCDSYNSGFRPHDDNDGYCSTCGERFAPSTSDNSNTSSNSSSSGNGNYTYYPVDLEFVGFRVGTKNENGTITKLPKKITNGGETLNWENSGLIITELVYNELTYDSEKSVNCGKVIATSHYENSKVKTRTFLIPFGISDDKYTVTVYSDNPELGSANSNKNLVKPGETVKVFAEEIVSGTFEYWYKFNEAGKKEIVTYSKEHSFTMPEANVTLIAHFYNEAETHNLYVTSNNPDWGEAWTYDNEQRKTWHEAKAITGEEYDIKYEAKPGYEFVRWEYRPRYENPSEKNGKIKMPDYDITVTAIFREKDIIKRNDPTLYISVNNPTWGEAYIVTKNGNIYASKEPMGSPNSFVAQYNETYDIVYTPYTGYYFTGWITSPEIGLNSFADQLTMPNNNLTLTAFFSPIPEGGEGELYLYDITTRVEPSEGGKIIGNIPEKLPEGDTFEASIELNGGYELDYWYYLDPNGDEVNLGSNPIVEVTMPTYAIELVAKLKLNSLNKYNLYVTSNNPDWGEAYTEADDGSKVWKRLATQGQDYPINQIAKPGYEFVRWEYRPRYQNLSEKNGKIKMPGYDITVTAIFKEKDIIKRNDPTLYISVNNPDWGEAYIVADSGKLYASKDPEGSPNSFTAENGKTYDIVYNPKDGYYFTGWITSPEIGFNPFALNLTMPDHNLTLTAFFAPIPEDGYQITTRVEPPEGGKIVGDIPSKLPEGYTFGATAEANDGYVLDHWYYKDLDGNIINLGNDTTVIVEMPGHAIELVAVFTAAGTYNLYVTSNNPDWGEAYTEADNGSKVWERKAIEGQEYPINKIAKPGYEFVRWEYSPRYQNPSEKNGKIKMPGYDITVTAIFEEKEPADLNLYISVNNPLWGEAYIVADNGKVYANKDPEASPNSFTAENGKTYKIVYTPYEGYRFTGWITSPEIGLDKYADEITMGDTSLTLTAFFSPDNGNKISAISNNYSLGDVYIVTDDGEVHSFKSDESGIIFKPDIPYRVVSTEIDGRFVNFTINGEDIEKYKKNVKDLTPQELLDIMQKYLVTSVQFEESEAYKKIVDRSQIASLTASLDYSLLFGGIEEMMAIYAEFISPYDVNGISIINVADTWHINASKEAIRDTEIVINFKKDPMPDGDNSLTVKVDPASAAKSTSGSRNPAEAGVKYPISVELKDNWNVVGWYYKDEDGDIVNIPIANSKIDFEMPNHSVVLYAKCESGSHSLTVKADPAEAVKSTSGSTDSAIPGQRYPVSVELKDNWNVIGWYYEAPDGHRKYISKARSSIDFEMPNHPVVLYADCEYSKPEGTTQLLITSIRDLRWKDHFVDNKGNYRENNALPVPNEDTVIAKAKGYPTELKQGYAVEFSMTTAMLPPENAKLVITPKVIIGNSKTEIDPSKLYDAMGSKLVELGKKYSEIVIYGDNRNQNANFQTKATPTSPKPKNNGIEYDEITWEWLYYLPADIRNTDKSKITEDITIKFYIKSYNGEELFRDYLVSLDGNNISNWKGKVFKYSAEDSLLDDIYNNAQN